MFIKNLVTVFINNKPSLLYCCSDVFKRDDTCFSDLGFGRSVFQLLYCQIQW